MELTTTQSERRATPTGVERTFAESEIIVSKTDLAGKITYANEVFLDIAGYTEREVIGKPHSMIRHPDMPRAVFALLWETLEARREIFAYVMNMAKSGDHYWVFAHVTPTFADDGTVVGYHSNRRVPSRSALEVVRPLYAKLLAAENATASKREAVAAGKTLFTEELRKMAVPYDELMFVLETGDEKR